MKAYADSSPAQVSIQVLRFDSTLATIKTTTTPGASNETKLNLNLKNINFSSRVDCPRWSFKVMVT